MTILTEPEAAQQLFDAAQELIRAVDSLNLAKDYFRDTDIDRQRVVAAQDSYRQARLAQIRARVHRPAAPADRGFGYSREPDTDLIPAPVPAGVEVIRLATTRSRGAA